jgi:hypothetical protein
MEQVCPMRSRRRIIWKIDVCPPLPRMNGGMTTAM